MSLYRAGKFKISTAVPKTALQCKFNNSYDKITRNLKQRLTLKGEVRDLMVSRERLELSTSGL